jgi:L-iditol 2-dehydrogenase
MPPGTGRAAIVEEYGAPLEIVEYPVPEPEPGALVVAIEATTICGSDVHGWQGAYEGILPVELPLILGHEGAGRIVAMGAGAELDSVGTPLGVGDRVVWASESCGHCWVCTVAKETPLCPNRRLGMLTSAARPPHFYGMFAEYSYVFPNAGRLRVPDELPTELASVATYAARTVVNALERAGRIDAQDRVVVQGTGPVGLFCVAMAAAHSPRQIIAIGAPDERLAIARRWGAGETISIEEYDAPARLEEVMRLTDGHGADVLFEASGGRGAVPEGLNMAARTGRYVLIGATGAGTQEIEPHRIINKGLTVLGSFSGDIDSFDKAMRFMVANPGGVNWQEVIGRRYPLEGLTEALTEMREMRDIKPVIVPGAVS